MTGSESPRSTGGRLARSSSSYLREMARKELTRRGIDWRPPEQRENDFRRYKADPGLFVREALAFDPWDRQLQILSATALAPRVAVRSCHHSGKTWTAAAAVHWFTRAFDPSLVLTTAPTDRQVREVLWYEIAAQQRQSGLAGRMTETSLEVSATQRAFGFSTNTPERFQGWHSPNILIIADEASGVPENIYEAIEGCLTGPNAHLLLIGNPNNAAGTFYNAFRSPLYETFHISAYDVPERLLPPGWAEERRQEWGEESPAYQVRVLGNFPEQGEDSLISMRWVTAAQERSIQGADPDAASAVELGADIARFGSDESVCYVRSGQRVLDARYWRGQDTQVSAGQIAALARHWQAKSVKIDDIGVGAGVLDALKANDVRAVGVNVGEAAWDSEHFANRRAEIFWGLRERFRTGDIAIPADDTTLLAQLTSLRFSYTSRGQIKLESKEDMRKRGLPSPDRADALAIAFCAGGKPFAMPGGAVGMSKGVSDNPLRPVMGGRR